MMCNRQINNNNNSTQLDLNYTNVSIADCTNLYSKNKRKYIF